MNSGCELLSSTSSYLRLEKSSCIFSFKDPPRRTYSTVPAFTVHHVENKPPPKPKTIPVDPTVLDLESSHPSRFLPDTHHSEPIINGTRHDYNLDDHSHSVEVPKESFFRRELPKVCISFSSDEGKELFKEALHSGHMECYFPLAAQYRTQSEPAFCGLGTLTMALNALSIDPGRVWKGPWRWFSEEMLDCCTPLEVVKKQGITVQEFACLAKCNGALSELRYGSKSTVNEFRRDVMKSTKGTDAVIIASYSRKKLGQTGDGHFSPIGGYHPQRDMVLILEVARFKYPPHWVPLELLFDSMKEIDKVTGLTRGYITLRSGQVPAGQMTCTTPHHHHHEKH